MPYEIETLLTGYTLAEAPAVDDEGRLYFSDARGGGVYCLETDGRLHTVIPDRMRVGGMVLHADGGLVVTGKDVSHIRGDEVRVLLYDMDGGAFNDLCTDASGRVLVGTRRFEPLARPIEVVPGELHRIGLDGSSEVLYDKVGLPNGAGFSPDGSVLYNSDSVATHVIAHDVDDDGKLSGRRAFVEIETGTPDGLAVDEEGGVWLAIFGGGVVVRVTPHGKIDERIEVPARALTSVCFGGPERRDLYITTMDNTNDAELGGCVHRTSVGVAGLPIPPARV